MANSCDESFDPDLFVNREREIREVTDRVEQLKSGEAVERRVIVFYGPKGSGKTWLSCKLIQELRENYQVSAEHIDLADVQLRGATGPDMPLVLEEVFNRYVAKKPGGRDAWGPPPADNAQLSAHIVRLVEDAAKEQGVAVLILDHVNRLDRSAMDLVDQFLILPLSQLPRVVLVLNGRQDAPTWKSSQVRFKTAEMDLRPFPGENIRDQVERLNPSALVHISQIEELSGGYPLVTRLLTEAIAAGATNLHDALTRCVNEILAEVPDEPPPAFRDAPSVRECIRALAILSDFDEDRNKFFLAEFLHRPDLQNNAPHWHRTLIRALLDTQLVKPHRKEVGGYAIDDVVRHVVEAWLRETQYKEWIRRHCFALRFYDRWANEYAATAARWREKAEYHRSQLRAAGMDPGTVCA